MTSRKRAVSIRMSASDIGSVKKLAKRLGVRDSDVIRCAVKMMMTKLGPLADSTVRGRNLLPVFVESGNDLFRHFELDAVRLENIINDGVPADIRVEHEDIQLLAMHGVQRSYIKLRLNAIGNGRDGDGANGVDRLDENLRQYLYDKYVYRSTGNGSGNGNGQHIAGGF
jgi:hypothetical protein